MKPKKLKAESQRHHCVLNDQSNSIQNGKMKQPKYISVVIYINNSAVYVHNGMLFSLKKETILTHTTKIDEP